MTGMKMTRRAVLCGGLLAVAGCGGQAPEPGLMSSRSFADTEPTPEDKIRVLEQALLNLGPNVDPDEAARVARISVREPLVWAKRWGAVDSPTVHNMKVNTGVKPRGLCKDWADDLQVALQREKLRTLQLHRAIANFNTIWIEHSTVIISAPGDPMEEGIVLDPWRKGQGRLWFGTVKQDLEEYEWVPRAEVFAMKDARRQRQAGKN